MSTGAFFFSFCKSKIFLDLQKKVRFQDSFTKSLHKNLAKIIPNAYLLKGHLPPLDETLTDVKSPRMFGREIDLNTKSGRSQVT